MTFVAFDLFAVDGHAVMANPWHERRALLEELWIDSRVARLSDMFEDGQVLYDAVVQHGLEGILAGRRNGIFRPGYRGWTKIKNPSYWRRESEIAHAQRIGEARARGRVPDGRKWRSPLQPCIGSPATR